MDYKQSLQFHYRPKKGWVNDPNGLVYFQGYYHVFYQHAPEYEIPWKQAMHWGHARTKDFRSWEELPVALFPDKPYDLNGCFSGTAIVKDDTLYLFYASIRQGDRKQTVSLAYSRDGLHFEKYEKNPVIADYPAEGGPDFRDPAVCCIDGTYYCVMASGNPEEKMARLLLYKSADLLEWAYQDVMCEWENGKFAECPSLVKAEEDQYLLAASVCPIDKNHYFSIMYGKFIDGKFHIQQVADVDKGPDQYAGQVFRDHRGRNLLISWIPGWSYAGYTGKDVGCMSVPRQLTIRDGVVRGYPIEELQYLLKEEDPCLKRTETGFIIERANREPVVYTGQIRNLKILRDGYIAEVFVNGGEEIYSVLL